MVASAHRALGTNAVEDCLSAVPSEVPGIGSFGAKLLGPLPGIILQRVLCLHQALSGVFWSRSGICGVGWRKPHCDAKLSNLDVAVRSLEDTTLRLVGGSSSECQRAARSPRAREKPAHV